MGRDGPCRLSRYAITRGNPTRNTRQADMRRHHAVRVLEWRCGFRYPRRMSANWRRFCKSAIEKFVYTISTNLRRCANRTTSPTVPYDDVPIRIPSDEQLPGNGHTKHTNLSVFPKRPTSGAATKPEPGEKRLAVVETPKSKTTFLIAPRARHGVRASSDFIG